MSILPLLIISLLCVIVLTIVHQLTNEKIIENKQRAALKIINDVMPVDHDNDIFTDKTEIEAPAFLETSAHITVYRARLNNAPVAVSLIPIVAKGYNGNIAMVIGIAYDGTLTGVRIINHKETEGLGDNIHQDKSNWILGFNDRSLENTDEKMWAVKKDGGDFDQISGATITPRSVINIVYKVLEFYSENRDSFYQ